MRRAGICLKKPGTFFARQAAATIGIPAAAAYLTFWLYLTTNAGATVACLSNRSMRPPDTGLQEESQ